MKDILLFLKGFVSSPTTIGSVVPSSKSLARHISKQAFNIQKSSVRYLEVGGGSGALTKRILPTMNSTDTLDIVEVDPKFCKILKEKYAHLPNISIHEISILDFKQAHYDIVISSLPLNSFSSEFVQQVFLKFENLVKEGGFLSYFEYIGLKELKKTYLFGSSLSDFRKTLLLKQRFANKYCHEVDRIWWNLPPARVLHCKMHSVKH